LLVAGLVTVAALVIAYGYGLRLFGSRLRFAVWLVTFVAVAHFAHGWLLVTHVAVGWLRLPHTRLHTFCPVTVVDCVWLRAHVWLRCVWLVGCGYVLRLRLVVTFTLFPFTFTFTVTVGYVGLVTLRCCCRSRLRCRLRLRLRLLGLHVALIVVVCPVAGCVVVRYVCYTVVPTLLLLIC